MHKIRIGSLPDNDVIFKKPMVSGHHAELRFEDGILVLVDLNSTNGTFIDGLRIKSAPINAGQEISLGSFRFVLDPTHLRPLF